MNALLIVSFILAFTMTVSHLWMRSTGFLGLTCCLWTISAYFMCVDGTSTSPFSLMPLGELTVAIAASGFTTLLTAKYVLRSPLWAPLSLQRFHASLKRGEHPVLSGVVYVSAAIFGTGIVALVAIHLGS